MYCGGGKGRWARRACGCGVGEGEAGACPNAAAAARLTTATARKQFLAERMNSKRDRMIVSRINSAFDEKADREFWHHVWEKTSSGRRKPYREGGGKRKGLLPADGHYPPLHWELRLCR